jgi:hypothetical protein
VREYIAPDGGNPLAAKKAKESAVYQEVLKKTSAELHESLTIDPPTGGEFLHYIGGKLLMLV